MKPKNVYSCLFVVFFCAIIFPANLYARHDAKSISNANIVINTLAVMPFVKGKDSPGIDSPTNNTLICTLENLCLEDTDDEIPMGAAKKITEFVHGNLKKLLGEKVVSLGKTRDEYAALSLDIKTDTPRSLGRKIGRALNADHVLVGSLWKYDERLGGALSAERPASVAFVMYLVNVETGTELWKGYFDKTQESLSDNLLKMTEFFKQGGTWLTAEQLSRVGVNTLMKKFPAVK